MHDLTGSQDQQAVQVFRQAVAIMQRLRGPDGCPWDREQTFDSIQPHTLEEVYEVFDAIDRRAWPELRDELGDLLLQVLFYAQMAADEGHFTIADVVQALNEKLIRRHPHIFADAQAATATDVNRTWERVKQQERAGKGTGAGGLLDGVPRFVPALVEARKLGAKAAAVGFDWPDANGILDKVTEEVAEVREEVTAKRSTDRIEEELGDLLFTVAYLACHLRVDREQALRKASAKFRRRFSSMERAAGCPLDSLTPAEMDVLWSEVKRVEKLA